MNSSKSPESDASVLLSLRTTDDAVRTIAEHLKVKEMGPADHIRTKHEVKVFVESGDLKDAVALVKRASERRIANIEITVRQRQQQGQQRKI